VGVVGENSVDAEPLRVGTRGESKWTRQKKSWETKAKWVRRKKKTGDGS